MSYFAVCTFDLKNATREDYENAYTDLAALGFSTHLTANSGKNILLPTTTIAGEFSGSDAGALRDALAERVGNAFKARGFASEIFVSVGEDWAWGHRTT